MSLQNKKSDDDELENYFKENLLDIKENADVYWKQRREIFPNLFLLAKRYLESSVTSTEVEREFSDSGNIVTLRRGSLSPNNVNILAFLKRGGFLFK